MLSETPHLKIEPKTKNAGGKCTPTLGTDCARQCQSYNWRKGEKEITQSQGEPSLWYPEAVSAKVKGGMLTIAALPGPPSDLLPPQAVGVCFYLTWAC